MSILYNHELVASRLSRMADEQLEQVTQSAFQTNRLNQVLPVAMARESIDAERAVGRGRA